MAMMTLEKLSRGCVGHTHKLHKLQFPLLDAFVRSTNSVTEGVTDLFLVALLPSVASFVGLEI